MVLDVPVVIANPAVYPTAVLKLSVAVVKFWFCNADTPMAVDFEPRIFVYKAP